MKQLDYTIVLKPLPESDGGGVLAEVPDLPGCTADGETAEEASHEMYDAISSWIKTAEEFGDKTPIPSNLIS